MDEWVVQHQPYAMEDLEAALEKLDVTSCFTGLPYACLKGSTEGQRRLHEEEVIVVAQRSCTVLPSHGMPLTSGPTTCTRSACGAPSCVARFEALHLHLQAWKRGVKSLYYCRSKSIQRAESAATADIAHVPHLGRINDRDQPAAGEPIDYEECLACQ